MDLFKMITRQKDIPVVVEHDPWDSFFARRFNDSLNSTIYKVKLFVHTNPGKVFLAGAAAGGLTGFLTGLQAGVSAGLVLAKCFK